MKMRSKMQNEKGFTLVELMVVVVILGILVAIAVPVYNSVTEKAEKSAIMANLRTIDGAILQATVTETTAFTWATDQDTILAKYITGWPLTGPKSCSYKVESVTINSKAVDKAIATIPAKVAGYESGATVYLSGDVLVTK